MGQAEESSALAKLVRLGWIGRDDSPPQRELRRRQFYQTYARNDRIVEPGLVMIGVTTLHQGWPPFGPGETDDSVLEATRFDGRVEPRVPLGSDGIPAERTAITRQVWAAPGFVDESANSMKTGPLGYHPSQVVRTILRRRGYANEGADDEENDLKGERPDRAARLPDGRAWRCQQGWQSRPVHGPPRGMASGQQVAVEVGDAVMQKPP